MDEEDPAFDEDEYDNLEEAIGMKEEMLMSLRSKISALEMAEKIIEK